MNPKVTVKDGWLTIQIQLAPRVSNSGKTTLVASTGGTLKTGVQLDGKEISINLNATTPLDKAADAPAAPSK